MTTDPTEDIRRMEIALGIPEADLAATEASEEPVWTTEEFRQEFQAIGFMAPYVVVKRLSDGAKGTLEFTHSPRRYFGWVPD